MSAISTAIVTSIIVWCVKRKAAERLTSPAGATVIYDTPHAIKEHNDQSEKPALAAHLNYGGTVVILPQLYHYDYGV